MVLHRLSLVSQQRQLVVTWNRKLKIVESLSLSYEYVQMDQVKVVGRYFGRKKRKGRRKEGRRMKAKNREKDYESTYVGSLRPLASIQPNVCCLLH